MLQIRNYANNFSYLIRIINLKYSHAFIDLNYINYTIFL